MPAKATTPPEPSPTPATPCEPKHTYTPPYVVQLTSAPTTGGRKGATGYEAPYNSPS